MAARKPERAPPAHARWHEQFVCVSGEIRRVMVEYSAQPEKIDHVWIDLAAGTSGTMRLSLSTFSRQALALGLDPHLRLGIVPGEWEKLPAAGLRLAEKLDYAQIERATPVKFQVCERRELEELLLEKAGRAIWAEAWGDLYVRRGQSGLHQIHSRRASAAVEIDHRGRDGALKFYHEAEQRSELLLLKFVGQP